MAEDKKNIQEFRVQDWFEINGDETLRVDYDLNENSVVFDVGGYKGDWSNAIYEKYNCTIYIFEPIKAYADYVKKRFDGIDKIKVYTAGLSNENKKTILSVREDSTSIYKKGDNNEEVELIDVSEFIEEKKISKIDLLKVNIEGGEYDLLGRLINSDLIKIINNVQIQFHSFVENAENKMRDIQSSLKETHYLTYQFEFVWENWKKKKEPENFKDAIVAVDDLLEQMDVDNIQLKQVRRNSVELRKEKTEAILVLDAAAKELANAKNNLIECQNDLAKCRNSKSYKLGNLLLRPLIYIKEFFR